MESPTYPQLPQRPEPEPKPRGSWLTLALVLFGAVVLCVVLTFLTLGFFGPFVVLAAVIFAAIGLQYLVWGWWFERIYRTPLADEPPRPTVGERET